MKKRTAAQRWGAVCMRNNRLRFADDLIYIYAYADDANRVLYVGRTWHPATRNAAHRQRAAWWTPDLTFAVVETVIGWAEAVEAEARAIRDLDPVHNIVHNRRSAA